MNAGNAISLRDLSYKGKKTQLHNIHLDVGHGEIFGILGPDGAGKTTLLKILTGLITQYAGEAVILGVPLCRLHTIRASIGYVSQTRKMYDTMTVEGIHRLCRSLYTNWKQDYVDHILVQIGISRSAKMRELHESRKCLLYTALTLAARPRILFIDEPMDGMDDMNRELLKSILLDYIDTGEGTIVTASGTISEIAGMIDRFAVMKEGQMIFSGNIDEAMERFCKVRIVPHNKETDIPAIPGVYGVEKENRSFLVKINHDKERALESLKGIPNDFLDIMPMGIHEIYMEIVKEGSR